MNDRRSTRRRNLPFVRSAVLEVGSRSHVVVVTDLSADGAFLSTRIALDPSESLRLRVILPRDGREVVIPCRLVWRSERFDPDTGRAAGIAVRFEELEGPARRLLDGLFVGAVVALSAVAASEGSPVIEAVNKAGSGAYPEEHHAWSPAQVSVATARNDRLFLSMPSSMPRQASRSPCREYVQLW